MAIRVSWDDPTTKTISRVDFEGIFNINDIFDAWHTQFMQIRSVNHKVYSLNTFNNSLLSGTGFSIPKIREFVAREQLYNVIFTVQVAERRLIRELLKNLAGTMNFEVHVVASLDQDFRSGTGKRRNVRLAQLSP